MERATLAKRCIFIEADKRFNETDIKQIFPNVIQLTALKKETTDDDEQIKWILLFTTFDDADKYVMQKRIKEPNIMIHSCSQNDIPNDWVQDVQSSSRDIYDRREYEPPGSSVEPPVYTELDPGQGHQYVPQFYPGQGYPQHWEGWQPPPYDLNKPPSQSNFENIPTQPEFKEHAISNTPTQQTGQQFVHVDHHRDAWQPPPPYDVIKPPSQSNLENIPTQPEFKKYEISNTPTQQTGQNMGQQFVHKPYDYYGLPSEFHGQPNPTGTTGNQQEIAAPSPQPIQYPGVAAPNPQQIQYPGVAPYYPDYGYPSFPGQQCAYQYPNHEEQHHYSALKHPNMPMAPYPQRQPPSEPQPPGGQFYQQSANCQQSEQTVDRYKDTSGKPCTTDIQHSRSESVESQNIEDMEVSPEKSARTEERRESVDKQQSVKMIKVTNIPPVASLDSITFFFENKRKSGGGDISDLDYDEESQTAIITFEEEEVAERVLSKMPLLFEKKLINVELYMPETQIEEVDEQSTEDQEISDQPTEYAIEVRGTKPTTTKDAVTFYFEGRRGANADVVKIVFVEEENMYMVWFEEEEAIEVILSKSPHKLDGQILEVKRYIPPPPPKPVPKYDNKIFLTNVSPTTTKEGLENFLEAKSKVMPTEIIFGEAEGTALVTFEKPPDIAKLQAACTNRPLDDSHLKIHSVPITDCVVVTGFTENTSPDTLEYYFDNKRRSGVEGVASINLKKDEGQCFISFSHPDSALEVCKREHKVEGCVLQVQVYYECLGQAAIDEDGPKFKPVKDMFIPNLNPKKIEFIVNCKMNKKAFEKQLSTHYASVVWPDGKDIGDTLEVECTLTEEVKDCRKLAKTWAKNVTVETEKFFDMLVVNIHETYQEMWDDIMGHIRDINIPNPESVAIRVVKKEFKIIIVGHKIPADEVSEKVGDIIKKVAIELDQKKLQVTEEASLKHYQLLVLLYLHFMDKMKQQFEGLNAVPDMKKHCMIFTGMSGQVTAAKVKMFEQIQEIVGTSAGKFSDGFIQYLKTPLVKSFLGQQFKQKGVLGVWDIQEDNVIMMYSLSDEGVVTAVSVLKESIKEAPITLDSKEATLVGMKIWKQEVNVIETEYKNALVKITVVDPNTVAIYLTSAEDEGLLMEKIRDIFFKHAVSEEIVKLPSAEMRLLQEQYSMETNKLVEVFSKEHVKLRIDNIGIFIQGNAMGVDNVKKQINEIVKSIYKNNYTLNKAGIVKYMHSDPGRAKITQIEKKNKVVVEMKFGDDSDDEARESVHTGTWTETAVCSTPTGQTITTVVGDITDLSVDVIVNAANKELQHVGGLAKVIVDKGGKGIQKECDDYVSTKNRKKQMYMGEVFCSSAGNLNCKMIAHAVGPVWQGGRNTEDEYLSECIQASLERTEDKRYQSIAIPALCTGVFGYPADKATKVIVEAIRDFLKENGSTTYIRQIYLCDVKNDSVDYFVAALERFYNKANVTKQRGRSNVPLKNKRHHALDKENKHGRGPSPKRHTSASNSHISITIVRGQIASQEVDVLVNTTSNSLQLNQGAVSQSLLKVGGPGLQSECSQKYPNGIQAGEVAETSGAKLECKLVCHGALPGWNGDSSAKVMENFMKTCLQKTSDKGFVSIAFPALGTGNLGYPKNLVARNMFSCVERFSTSNPGTSVCDVRFVVYERDMNTIQAFEEEQRKRQAGEYTSRTNRNFDSEKSKDYSGDKGVSGGFRHESMDTDKQASVDIGDLTLKVYQGDITEVSVDVIVNGTNRDLDLTRGAVSQAIAKKGGNELAKLLRAPSIKKEMKNEGITITLAGGRLNCEYIIHVNMEDSRLDLKTKFKDVLEKVDELNQETVALPALGAGMSGTSIEKVADHLFEALISFQRKKTDVTEVHVVIFQGDMLSKFLSAMQGCLLSHNARSQGLLNRFSGWLGFSDKNPVKGNEWKVSKMPSSSLNLVVYGKTRNSTDIALRSLEESMASDFKERMIEDPVVKNLTKDQEARIKNLEDTCEVDIELIKRLGRIMIRGLPENLSEAVGDVHKIILDVDRQKQKHQHAQLVKDMVQWYFISVEDTGQTLEEYPAEVNLTLEQALKNNDPQAFFLDNNGNKYIVDFTNYEEYPEDDPTDTVAVLRKSKMTDSAFDMPSNWTAMDDSENVKIVTLQPSDKEYTDVIKDFQTQMGSNYSTIVKVEKIQNRTLQQQYVAKKKLMDSTNQVGHKNECKLWHGTAIDAVDSINTYGFNRSYCGKNAVAYGNGVYFAVNPTYSAQSQYARPDPHGNKRMYICKVLVGEFTQGKGGMKVPPQKAGAAGSHILYDSVVDNLAAPGIFVIFHDTQAYPEYLIVFK